MGKVCRPRGPSVCGAPQPLGEDSPPYAAGRPVVTMKTLCKRGVPFRYPSLILFYII